MHILGHVGLHNLHKKFWFDTHAITKASKEQHLQPAIKIGKHPQDSFTYSYSLFDSVLKTALAPTTRILILLVSPQLKGFLVDWDQQLVSLEAWQLPRNIVLSQNPFIRYWQCAILFQPLTQLLFSVIDTRLFGITRKYIHTIQAPWLLPDVDRAVLGSWHF